MTLVVSLIVPQRVNPGNSGCFILAMHECICYTVSNGGASCSDADGSKNKQIEPCAEKDTLG